MNPGDMVNNCVASSLDKGKQPAESNSSHLLNKGMSRKRSTVTTSLRVVDEDDDYTGPSFSLGFMEEGVIHASEDEMNVVFGDVKTDAKMVGCVEPLTSSVRQQSDLNIDKKLVTEGGVLSSINVMMAEKDLLIKDLEAALELEKEKVLRLKNDLAVKDKLGDAEIRKSNLGFMEAARDTIDALRADVVESRQVQDRLGGQCMASQRRIKALEEESLMYKDKLKLEIAKTLKLSTDYAALDLSEQEIKNKKLQLVIENDRLKVEIGVLCKRLDTAMALSSSGSFVVEVMKKPNPSDSKPPAGSISSLTLASLEAGGPSHTKIAITGTTLNKAYGDINGVRLFSSPVVAGASYVNTIINPSVKTSNPSLGYTTPITVKIEPVEDNNIGAGVIVRSNSPDTEISKRMRIQERMLINSKMKKEVVYPMSLTYENTPMKLVPDNMIRGISVDRACFAYQKTLPYYINFLIENFKDNLPSATFLEVQNTYMNNFITLLNIEQLMNHDKIEDSVIDTWGLLINKENGESSNSMQTRRLVSKTTYLFRSFCWMNIARHDVNNWYKKMCSHFIDMKILDTLRYKTWLFPICTTGLLDPCTNEGDHWCLLRYGVEEGVWNFYNPLQPVKQEDDEHYAAAMILVRYVERQIKQSGCAMRLPVLRADHVPNIRYYKDTPQQSAGSLDCGVVVCDMMEMIITKGMVTKTIWTDEYGGEQRARMINKFCETVMNLQQ